MRWWCSAIVVVVVGIWISGKGHDVKRHNSPRKNQTLMVPEVSCLDSRYLVGESCTVQAPCRLPGCKTACNTSLQMVLSTSLSAHH